MGPLTQLPAELILGWALWIVGGLLLTIWFLRRSSSPRLREASAATAAGGGHLSGAHSVASRSQSGVRVRTQSAVQSAPSMRLQTPVAARTASGTRPQAPSASAVHGDAFDELRALLDAQGDPPQPV